MAFSWENTEPNTRLTRRQDVLPVKKTTPAEAQGQVNFVVFESVWMPPDCTLESVTLRPEQPPGRPGVEAAEIGQTPWTEANPSSLRAILQGDGRCVRIKQFLYDWAPPAASTAPLWNSPSLMPFTCAEAIGWLGRDYMKRQGACVQRARTQIELSVEMGEFTNLELVRILTEMQPANPEASQAVRRAPFHQLNYWVRYQMRSVKVPYGLWQYNQSRHYDHGHSVSEIELRERPPLRVLWPANQPYELDSSLVIEDERLPHKEVELIFRHQANLSDHLWVVVMNADSPLALPVPPELHVHHPSQTHGKRTWRKEGVWYAAVNERHGAWEAFWEEGGLRYAVWASSSQFIDAQLFENLIRTLRD
jgi:hypothetical protein